MASETSVDTAPMVAEIARTRADLGASIEALANRVAPKKLIARAKVQFAAKVEELKERFHPVRIVQRKLGKDRPAVGRSGAGVLTVGTGGTRENAPALGPGAR
jgi:hypothetical protein